MSLRQAKVVEQVKESFLTLCKQYEGMGKLLALHAKATAQEGEVTIEGLIRIVSAEVTQYNEIGEQLKTLGTAIDLLGGRPVLQAQPRLVSGTPNELKRQGFNVPKGRES